MKKYIYTRLPKGHSEIRLMRLLPGPFEAEIQIQIFHATISTNPEYEALSYTWGCPDETQVVHVEVPTKPPYKMQKFLGRLKLKGNGKETKTTTIASLGVAENLFVALQHLRSTTLPRVLWADAICINQKDDVERGSEVIEMGSIYNNAKKVIVWLGPSSHNSDLAMQTLERLGKGILDEGDTMALGLIAGRWTASLAKNPEALVDHADCWVAVRDVLSRRWFSRLWVFQEIWLAKQADLVVGALCLDWKIAVRGLLWIRTVAEQLDRQIQLLGLSILIETTIWSFLERGCYYKLEDLIVTLKHSSSLACSDARDRLYAIRSLLISSHREIVVPNYTVGVEDMYIDFTTKWLLELRNAQFLRFCSLPPQPPSSGSGVLVLPSWVPDWTHPMESTVLNGVAAGTSLAFSTVMDESRLGIQGVLIGSLSIVIPPVVDVEVHTTEAELRQLCRSWMQICVDEGLAGDESSVDDSFVEMLVAGEVAEKRPSLDRVYPSLDQIRASLSDDPNLDSKIKPRVSFFMRRALQGRLLFTTTDGAMGIASSSARPGDHVAVLLGCDVPMVVRPMQLSGTTRHRIVGPCYIPGFMCGEALLGPLLAGWSWRLDTMEGAVVLFSNEDTRTRTQQDPRMPLPPAWRYRHGSWDAPEGVEAEKLKNMTQQWFENVETGEKQYMDPRLTSEFLRERGVKVEELVII